MHESRGFLDEHRRKSENPETGIMFKTRNNTPLNMNNLLNDQIRPAFDRYVCGEGKADHAGADHGLATNLHALEWMIWRCSAFCGIAMSQSRKIATSRRNDEQRIAAMQEFEGQVVDRARLICKESAKASLQMDWVN
jgi:hypothetical protein